MKKILSEYYPFEYEYFTNLWKEAIIIPDANILLNLYSYSRNTSDELISILDKFKERLWLPYQVALEYQRNRLAKIRFQKETYNLIEKIIQKHLNSIKTALEKNYPIHPVLKVSKIKKDLDDCFKKIKQYLDSTKNNHPDWVKNDEIRNKLTELFEGKIGKPYTKDKLKEFYDLGYFRYKNEMPPGYRDEKEKKEKERKYGDLIIWLDIIEKAKEEKKSIIFINDERKDDWWQKNNNDLIPRFELLGEIRNEAGVSFYMYNALDFVKCFYKLFNKTPKGKVLNEIKTFKDFSIFLENLKRQNEELFRALAVAKTTIETSHLAETLAKIGAAAKTTIETSHLAETLAKLSKNNINTNEIKKNINNTKKNIKKNVDLKKDKEDKI